MLYRAPLYLVALAGTLACGRVGFESEALPLASVELRADWVTSNSIRWEWKDPSTLRIPPASLELVVAKSADGLDGASAIVFTSLNNPELGLLDDDTISDGLLPDTEYVAQLTLLDSDGVPFARSQELPVARTLAPTSSELVLFSDLPTDGYSIPSEFVHSESNAFKGTHCYEFVSKCETDERSCFENLRRQGLAIDLTSIGAAAFETAYAEFAVAADPGVHSEWSQLRFMMRDTETDETRIFSAGSFTIRADGAYRIYQVPLASMLDDNRPLTYAVAETAKLYEFGVGGTWTAGATVRFDELRILY